jgi:hypothetical protein
VHINSALSTIISSKIGQRFAGLEERVVLSTLFRRYSFRSTQSIDELHLSLEIILRPEVPIEMFINRR